MNASLKLDVNQSDLVRQAVSPAIDESGRITASVTGEDTVQIDIETDSLGTLRGVVNSALMLTKLSDTVINR